MVNYKITHLYGGIQMGNWVNPIKDKPLIISTTLVSPYSETHL